MKQIGLFFIVFSITTLIFAQQFTYDPSFDTNIFSRAQASGDGTPWNDFDKYFVFLKDMNNDGITDMAAFGQTNIYLNYGCGTGWGTSVKTITSSGAYTFGSGWSSRNSFPRYFYDMTGDGHPDIVGFSLSSVSVWQLDANSNPNPGGAGEWIQDFAVNQGWTSQNQKPRFIADVNGDNRGDIVAMTLSTLYSLNQGSTFGGGGGAVNDYGYDVWTNMDEYPRILADADGDGNIDIVGFFTDGVYVSLGSGTGTFGAKSLWLADFSAGQGWTSQSTYPRAMADVNGDGKADVVGFKDGVWVALAGTNSFAAATQWRTDLSFDNPSGEWESYNTAPRMLADVNCDGKADIVSWPQLGGGIKVYLSGASTGTYCNEPCYLCSPSNVSCTLCDMLPVHYLGSSCSCPPRTTLSSGACINTVTSLNLALDASVCGRVTVTTDVTAEEIAFYREIYIDWSITSNSSNATKTTQLQNYVTNFKGYELVLTSQYLELGVLYQVTGSRKSPAGTTLQDTESFIFDNIKVTSQPVVLCSLKRTEDNTFGVEYTIPLSGCVSVVLDWTVTVGPAVDTTQLIKSGNTMTIPKCLLEGNTSYEFTVKVHSAAETLGPTNTYSFTTLEDDIRAQILNTNVFHPFDSPLNLTGGAVTVQGCPINNLNSITFSWECQRAPENSITFSPCNDPSSIFGVPSSTSYLIVPTTYLEQGSTMQFYLTITQGLISSVDSISFRITKNTTLFLTVECTTPQCAKINPFQAYDFVAVVANDPGVGYLLQWSLSYPVIFVSNFKNLHMSESGFNGITSIDFRVDVMSNKYSGTGLLNIPINTFPSGGSINVIPVNGISFQTMFIISADGWTDEDQPLTYQYIYSIYNTTSAITEKILDTIISTFLPGDEPAVNVTVMVKISDWYGATVSNSFMVDVEAVYDNLPNTINSMTNYVDDLPTDDIDTVLKTTLVADEIKNAQDNILALRENIISCTGCPEGASVCQFGTCQCRNSLQQTVDCTITQSVFNQNTEFNNAIIDKIDETIRVLTSNQNFTQEQRETAVSSALTTLRTIGTNPSFTTEENQRKIFETMENTLEILSPNVTLTRAQTTTISNVLSNSLKFSEGEDCSCTKTFCKNLEGKTFKYLEKLSSDSVKGRTAGEPPFTVSTDIFDLVTVRSTSCQLGSTSLNASPQAAVVSFFPVEKGEDACTDSIDAYYYAFPSRPQMFNCSRSREQKVKDVIMIKMVESGTQKSVANRFTVVPKMPKGLDCPKGCSGKVKESCFCQPSLFDVEAQLANIFRLSNIGDLANVEALLSWEWYKSPMFWVNIFFFIWFVTTMYVLTKKEKYAKLCLMKQKVDDQKIIPIPKAAGYLALIASNIANMYMLERTELSKRVRVALYYIRLILMGTFASIFSSAKQGKTAGQLLNEMQIYVILLPYFTVIPINAILATILKKQAAKEVNTKGQKIKQIIIFTIMAIFLAACILAMFIIAANKTEDAQLPWALILIVTFIQDLFVSPIAFICTQIAFFFILRHAQKKNIAKIIKLLEKKVDKNFSDIFTKIPHKYIDTNNNNNKKKDGDNEESFTLNGNQDNINADKNPNGETKKEPAVEAIDSQSQMNPQIETVRNIQNEEDVPFAPQVQAKNLTESSVKEAESQLNIQPLGESYLEDGEDVTPKRAGNTNNNNEKPHNRADDHFRDNQSHHKQNNHYADNSHAINVEDLIIDTSELDGSRKEENFNKEMEVRNEDSVIMVHKLGLEENSDED